MDQMICKDKGTDSFSHYQVPRLQKFTWRSEKGALLIVLLGETLFHHFSCFGKIHAFSTINVVAKFILFHALAR